RAGARLPAEVARVSPLTSLPGLLLPQSGPRSTISWATDVTVVAEAKPITISDASVFFLSSMGSKAISRASVSGFDPGAPAAHREEALPRPARRAPRRSSGLLDVDAVHVGDGAARGDDVVGRVVGQGDAAVLHRRALDVHAVHVGQGAGLDVHALGCHRAGAAAGDDVAGLVARQRDAGVFPRRAHRALADAGDGDGLGEDRGAESGDERDGAGCDEFLHVFTP